MEPAPIDCSDCVTGSGGNSAGNSLRPAPGSPGLRGSRFVGARGVRNLYVCRNCGALWWTWIDQRDGWRGALSLGRLAVPIFAESTDLTRVVSWVASQYREDVFRPVFELARRVIRRKPDGLQGGVDSMLREIASLSAPDSELKAERLTMLFRMLTLVVERTVLGDLRPAGARVRSPRRWTDDEVAREAARFVPREEDELARLAFTHDVLRRLLWERRFGQGAASPDEAVVAIRDVSPIVNVMVQLPFDDVEEGTRRGVFAAAVFEAATDLVNRGLVPENDHAFWMSEEDWRAVRHQVDPVVRLAGSARRLLIVATYSGAEARARVEMEAVLARAPIGLGARFTDTARKRLENDARQFRDEVAVQTFESILDLERKAFEADQRCRI